MRLVLYNVCVKLLGLKCISSLSLSLSPSKSSIGGTLELAAPSPISCKETRWPSAMDKWILVHKTCKTISCKNVLLTSGYGYKKLARQYQLLESAIDK